MVGDRVDLDPDGDDVLRVLEGDGAAVGGEGMVARGEDRERGARVGPQAGERLAAGREERRNLVGTIARRTGEEHRVINARINRDVGAPSVAKATVEQLEKANRLLEREAAR